MSEILRKCTNCGLEAFTKNDLTLFVNGSNRNKYGKINLCTLCSRELANTRYRYKEFANVRNFFNMATSPLRKCKFCGLEAWDEKELIRFASASGLRGTHGKYNICKQCYSKKYVKKEYSLNRINFKNKTINLDKNPRINTCSNCGKSYPDELTTQTHLHHFKYDESNPTKYTIELCNSCHQAVHKTSKKHKYDKL